jgi:hypothetical protein
LKDFERYQQSAAVDVQDSKDKLQDQDVKIKQLSSQIAQLNAALNALQASTREAQASVLPSQTPKVPKKNAEHRSAHSPAAPVSLSHLTISPIFGAARAGTVSNC